ncbi:MAG: ECF transporter S component [Oscillospiraceae bacterium]|nr:ECF transporter S component [Oscillospiraceae bacterium]
MDKKNRRLAYSALFLALALVLPFLTGQIPTIGKALSPMHIPVMLCGFLCGPLWGAAVGAVAPLLRSVLFGMPAMFPGGVAMTFELTTYGILSGWLYRLLPRKPWSIYVSLLVAMVCGRLVWGAARFALAGLSGSEFPFSAFLAGAVTGAVPGIILHIVLIPLLVMGLERAKLTLD